MEVVNNGGLVEMRELCHVVGLVEFGWIDLVDSLGVDLLLGAIVALYQKPAGWEFFYYPTSDEGSGRVPKPDITLPREVVLALDYAARSWCIVVVLGYKLRRKCADWCANSVRIRSQTGGFTAVQQRAAEMCERLVS